MVVQSKGSRSFGFVQFLPALIMGGSSIFGTLFNRGPSQAEKSAAFEAAMQQQAEWFQTTQIIQNAVIPAIAIIGGIMLLRKS